MEPSSPPSPFERCSRCYLQRRVCLCATLRAIPTRTHVVVVRHQQERFKVSNSARIAALAMPNAEIRDYSEQGPPPLGDLAAPGVALLFPDGARPWDAADPPRTLVVLDGSWGQARRMRQRIAAVHGLPFVSLAAAPPRPRLRRAPDESRVSTLEAIAGAIALLEGPDAAAPIYELFDDFAARSLATRRRISTPAPPAAPAV